MILSKHYIAVPEMEIEIKKKTELVRSIYPTLNEAIESQKNLLKKLHMIKIYRNYDHSDIEFEKKLAIEYRVLLILQKELKQIKVPIKKKKMIDRMLEYLHQLIPILFFSRTKKKK